MKFIFGVSALCVNSLLCIYVLVPMYFLVPFPIIYIKPFVSVLSLSVSIFSRTSLVDGRS